MSSIQNKKIQTIALIGMGGLLLAALFPPKNPPFKKYEETTRYADQMMMGEKLLRSAMTGNLPEKITEIMNSSRPENKKVAAEYARNMIFLKVDALNEKTQTMDQILTPAFKAMVVTYVKSGPEAATLIKNLPVTSNFRKLIEAATGKEITL